MDPRLHGDDTETGPRRIIIPAKMNTGYNSQGHSREGGNPSSGLQKTKGMDPRLRGDDAETGPRRIIILAQVNARANSMNQQKTYFVYILASKPNGTLYTGITSNLAARIWQHKNDLVDGFTQKYTVHSLVYFEEHSSPSDAILREKQIKKWNRSWKIRLIEEKNPEWKDFWEDIASF